MKAQNLIIGFLVVTLIALLIYKFKFKSKKMENSSTIPTEKNAYIKWLTPTAKVIEKKTGVPYKFIIAQTGLETSWGKSTLLQKAFNFAGIKAKKGEPFITMQTKEFLNGKMVTIPQNFWKGENVTDGLLKYVKILQLPRYKAAFKYSDPLLFAAEIKKGGYATDPKYVDKIKSILPSIA